MKWLLTIACLTAALLSGCARYQFGIRSLYPADVSTVYVPIFESDSFRRNLGERLTEAVVKKIELQTPYKVVDSADADSILSGHITGHYKQMLVQNGLDEGREVQVDMRVNVSWVNRRGDAIRAEQAVPLAPEVISIFGRESYVPEAGQSVSVAQQRAIEQIAQQIVATMDAPW